MMDNKNLHRTCRECGGTMQHKCKVVKGKFKSRLQCPRCGWVKPNILGDAENWV